MRGVMGSWGCWVAMDVGAGFKPALPAPCAGNWGRATPCPSFRSTGKCAIRRVFQVRSNPVPGGQHTDYVS
ncbi:MAG: hypothetical protein LBM98_03065 [Oscillospiraceae bacterium]|nr:hypothetical protein [Oscillospiraceae bacterium]